MKKKIGMILMGALMMLGACGWGLPVRATTLCDDPEIVNKHPDLAEAAGCNVDNDKTIMPVLITLVQVALGVIGLVAVGVIIYGGITYAISTGDAAKIYKAKNIILYGIVGMVVAALAFAIVTFVSSSLSSAMK